MRATALDRRVRTEAEALVRDARAALRRDPVLRGKAGQLEAAVAEVSAGLAAKDLRQVRRGLPPLDELVDELVKEPATSITRDYVESIGSAVLIALALRAMVLAAFEIPSSSMYPTVQINDHIFVNKLVYGLQIPLTRKVIPWSSPERGEVIVFLQPCTTDRDYIKRVIATEGQTVEVRCNVIYVDGVAIAQELVNGESCSYDDKREIGEPWAARACSEYVEHVGGRSYHTFHDPDRPRRDQLAKANMLASSDLHDFPRIGRDLEPASCAHQADGEHFESPNQLPGALVETKAHAGACEQQLHYVVPKGHVFAMGDNRSNSTDSRSWGSVPVENIRGKALFIWLSYRDWSPIHWGLRWKRLGSFVE
jgi:signal peptidase I